MVVFGLPRAGRWWSRSNARFSLLGSHGVFCRAEMSARWPMSFSSTRLLSGGKRFLERCNAAQRLLWKNKWISDMDNLQKRTSTCRDASSFFRRHQQVSSRRRDFLRSRCAEAKKKQTSRRRGLMKRSTMRLKDGMLSSLAIDRLCLKYTGCIEALWNYAGLRLHIVSR